MASNNRYSHLFSIEIDSCIVDCPIEIEKGALLFDTKTKNVLLQLRLKVLNFAHNSIISSVGIEIESYNDDGIVLQDTPHFFTYIDVNLSVGETFGDKTPIALDPTCRKAKVRIERIVFANGLLWNYSGGEIKLASLCLLSNLSNDLQEQVCREIDSLNDPRFKDITYIPEQLDAYWICTCGRYNPHNLTSCCRCGISKTWVFSHLSKENLSNNLETHIQQIKKQTEDRKENTRKYRRLFIILIVVGIIIGGWLILVPFIKYNLANISLGKGEYSIALKNFKELGNYRDSLIMQDEVKYRWATSLYGNGQTVESFITFYSLNDYKDSRAIASNILAIWRIEPENEKYSIAKSLYEHGWFSTAKDLFDDIPNYQNTNAYINKITSLLGIQGNWTDDSTKIKYKFQGWNFSRSVSSSTNATEMSFSLSEENLKVDTVYYVYPEWSLVYMVNNNTFVELSNDKKIVFSKE